MSGWFWYWVAWFVVGFGVPEGYAIYRKRTGDTLSGQVWWLERKFRPLWLVVAVGMAWLTMHFLGGGHR
jgi:hypothetical protein